MKKKLSVKDLSLGYIQQRETSAPRPFYEDAVIGTVLWREHEVYHIRSHEYNGAGRLAWHRARTYSLAQAVYKDHILAFHTGRRGEKYSGRGV